MPDAIEQRSAQRRLQFMQHLALLPVAKALRARQPCNVRWCLWIASIRATWRMRNPAFESAEESASAGLVGMIDNLKKSIYQILSVISDDSSYTIDMFFVACGHIQPIDEETV